MSATSSPPTDADATTILQPTLRREAPAAVAYALLFIASLFATQENQLAHWLTLVALPLIVIRLHQRQTLPWRMTLASVGLRRGNLDRGLLIALAVGGSLGGAQLLVSNKRDEILDAFASGRFLYLLPLAFVLFLLVAGITEELFFRGILQTRLAARLRSEGWAIVVAALLFGLYHLPYAYLGANWASQGNLGAALMESMVWGSMAGLAMGAVYAKSAHNLLASVLTHTLIMAPVVMTSIHLQVGGA